MKAEAALITIVTGMAFTVSCAHYRTFQETRQPPSAGYLVSRSQDWEAVLESIQYGRADLRDRQPPQILLTGSMPSSAVVLGVRLTALTDQSTTSADPSWVLDVPAVFVAQGSFAANGTLLSKTVKTPYLAPTLVAAEVEPLSVVGGPSFTKMALHRIDNDPMLFFSGVKAARYQNFAVRLAYKLSDDDRSGSPILTIQPRGDGGSVDLPINWSCGSSHTKGQGSFGAATARLITAMHDPDSNASLWIFMGGSAFVLSVLLGLRVAVVWGDWKEGVKSARFSVPIGLFVGFVIYAVYSDNVLLPKRYALEAREDSRRVASLVLSDESMPDRVFFERVFSIAKSQGGAGIFSAQTVDGQYTIVVTDTSFSGKTEVNLGPLAYERAVDYVAWVLGMGRSHLSRVPPIRLDCRQSSEIVVF